MHCGPTIVSNAQASPGTTVPVALSQSAPMVLDWLSGETGELIRAFDWTSTSLGPISAWPQSLKTTVATLLRSPVPIVLLWGEDGFMIYNDAYSAFAEGRHPRLLGSKVREGWPEVASFNDNVMKVGLRGGTLSYRDKELTLYRKGVPEQVWMNLDYSPVLDESGRPAGVLAVVIETTERVLAQRALANREEHRQLLVRELNHRMKNLFAVASGLVGLTARSARTPQDLAQSLRDRFDALARAKELVYSSAEKSETTSLEALVRRVLSPYLHERVQDRQPVVFGGPPVRVSGKAATDLALVLHESATNAMKYGALQTSEGSVRIEWTVRANKLFLNWEERDGPVLTASPEAANGFGTLLVRRSVTGQLGGEIEHDWRAEGLAIRIVIPLERLG